MAAALALGGVVILAFHVFLLLGSVTMVDWLDEQSLGLLARHLTLHALLSPLPDYRTIPREGGLLPISLWVYPFFRVLGPSVFALKVAATSFMVLAALPWIALARRIGGWPAAGAIWLVFLLPPPRYLLSMSVIGLTSTHLGNVLFLGLALLALYRGYGDRSLRPPTAAFAAGVALGLGCAWALTFAAVALGAGIYFVLQRPRRRELALLAAGAAPGVMVALFACLLPELARESSEVTGLARARLAGSLLSPGALASAAWTVVTDTLPRLAGEVEPGRSGWVPLVYRATTVASLAILAASRIARWRGHAGVASLPRVGGLFIPALLQIVVYAVAIAGIESYSGPRFLLALVPLGALAIALAAVTLPRLLGRRPGAWLAAALLGSVAVAGAHRCWAEFHVEAFPTPLLSIRGYAAGGFGYRAVEPVVAALSTPGRDDYEELARTLGALAYGDPNPDDGSVAHMHRALWPAYWQGVGALLLAQAVETGDVTPCVEEASNGPRWKRAAVLRGLARAHIPTPPPWFVDEASLYDVLLRYVVARLPAADRTWARAVLAASFVERSVATGGVAAIPPGVAKAGLVPLLVGYARGLAAYLLPTAEVTPELLEGIVPLDPAHRRRVAAWTRTLLRRSRALAALFRHRAPMR